jgi:lysophospholipase L1-like esterase
MSSHFLVRPWPLLSALSAVCLVAHPPAGIAEIAVKSGEQIVFLGDSITANGAASPSGFVRLVISGLESNGIKATAIPAGIIGNKSNEMLVRLDRDVIAKKPSWLALSCGLNDVWLGGRGIALEPFRDNVTAIVDRTQAAGIKVLILTSTMIGQDPANPHNQKAVAYNEVCARSRRTRNACRPTSMARCVRLPPRHLWCQLAQSAFQLRLLCGEDFLHFFARESKGVVGRGRHASENPVNAGSMDSTIAALTTARNA